MDKVYFNLIRKLLEEIFKEKINKLKKEFKKKYKIKEKQFIYSEIFSKEILFYLAITSSLESKVGNALNEFLIKILKEQVLADFLGWMSVKEMKKEFKVEIEKSDFVFKCKEGKQKVDLILITKDRKKVYLFEIKTGGNLDSKKGKKEIEVLKKIKEKFEDTLPRDKRNEIQVFICFGTLYNPKGEEANWFPSFASSLKQDDCVKIGKNFWEFFFREKIKFRDFVDQIYKVAAQNANFEQVIEELKKQILSSSKRS